MSAWSDMDSVDELSDMGSATSMGEQQNDANMRDYWFGKRHWEYHVAKSINAMIGDDTCAPELDAIWSETLHGFPYAQYVRGFAMDSENVPNHYAAVEYPFRTLMTRIGKMVRLEDVVGEKSILKELSQFLEKRPLRISRVQSDGTAPKQRTPTEPSYDKSENSGGDQLPRYTMALYEHAAQSGGHIKWDERQLSLCPPCFQASVYLQGMSFEGNTSTKKKIARHLAAREACEALDIVL